MDLVDVSIDTSIPAADLVVTRAFDAIGALVLGTGARLSLGPRLEDRAWRLDPTAATSAVARPR